MIRYIIYSQPVAYLRGGGGPRVQSPLRNYWKYASVHSADVSRRGIVSPNYIIHAIRRILIIAFEYRIFTEYNIYYYDYVAKYHCNKCPHAENTVDRLTSLWLLYIYMYCYNIIILIRGDYVRACVRFHVYILGI